MLYFSIIRFIVIILPNLYSVWFLNRLNFDKNFIIDNRIFILLFIISFLLIPLLIKIFLIDKFENTMNSYQITKIESGEQIILYRILFLCFIISNPYIYSNLIILTLYYTRVEIIEMPIIYFFFYKFYIIRSKARKYYVMSNETNLSIDNDLRHGFYYIRNFFIYFKKRID